MLSRMMSQQLAEELIQSQHREHLSQRLKSKMEALDAATSEYEDAVGERRATAAYRLRLAAHQALVAFEYLQDTDTYLCRGPLALVTAPFKVCPCCARTYTEEQWTELEPKGDLESEDETGRYRTEMRDCVCGSTIAIEHTETIDTRPCGVVINGHACQQARNHQGKCEGES